MVKTANDIRKEFINFFRSKDHSYVRSAPVLPTDDQTLLFTNAGMNQFKPIFLNKVEPDYKRAVNSQKCIRVSGKHNDLEEVGRDEHHHTFFEMLGNWSFGDYYKKDAILWHWELITEVWNLDKDRLWISVYNSDDESAEIWNKYAGVPKERILRFGNKENFWEMGETGPCGPCTEIHYYIGDNLKDQNSNGVNRDDIYREICNLVFIEFDRSKDGSLAPLPSKHVDTGMGLERIVSIINGFKSNYESDLFRPIIDKIISITSKSYNFKDGIPHRVIADHIRMISFSLADGILPSNEGRGYVVRRILRRASRFCRELGIEEPVLYKFVDIVEECMSEAFPEISDKKVHIKKIIKAEEESFLNTLDRGIEEFNKIIKEIDASMVIPGSRAFKLYDTFGFPIDLTEMMAREIGKSVDIEGFNLSMDAQKDRARSGSKFKQEEDIDWIVLSNEEHSNFVGYKNNSSESFIRLYRKRSDRYIELVLDKTPFYAESGGQVGDTGVIKGELFEFFVDDTFKEADMIIHKGRLVSGDINGGAKLTSSINIDRRSKIRLNHTATHILHRSLKNVLGDHVQQAGSLVSDTKLRFDITHYEPISDKELNDIQIEVNTIIRSNISLGVNEMGFDEARDSGAEALFGEKYGDYVRVVDINGFSKELCGGTHVDSTGDIGIFKIISESSLSSGVRRIEAVTGDLAINRFISSDKQISSIKRIFSCGEEEIIPTIHGIIKDRKTLQKEIKKLSSSYSEINIKEIIKDSTDHKGIRITTKMINNCSDLKAFSDKFRAMVRDNAVGVFATTMKDKPSIVCAVTKDISDKIDAALIVKKISHHINGGGGGTSTLATAGGKNKEGIDSALKLSLKYIKEVIDNG